MLNDCQLSKEARRQAEDSAAQRGAPAGWPMAQRQALSEFTTENIISEDDIAELEAVITTAEDPMLSCIT